jgi:predicted patatin/cPLA2 family phospholipase
MPDFGNTEETRMQMRNLLSSLNPLIEAIEYVSTHTKELKQSIEKLPRITTKLISAKQELLMLIDALIVIFERGMSLFLESRTKGNKFLETLERDQDC